MWNLQQDAIGKKDIEALCEWLQHMPRLTQSQQVSMFEAEFAKYQGSKYAVFVNSGSSANLLMVDAMIRQFDLQPGDKVIVPALTWATNVAPLIQLGLKPVFCDINLDDFSFDWEMLCELVDKEKPKAVFVTHVLGFPADMNFVHEAFYEDLIILEDCCESLGAQVGHAGLASTFSFYWGHHITSVEGGMVCTDDDDLYMLLVQKRAHGMMRDLPLEYHEWNIEHGRHYPDAYAHMGNFFFNELGYNFRNTEINAFLGRRQLELLPDIVLKRNANYMRFCSLLWSYAGFIQQPPWFKAGMSSFAMPLITPGRDRKTVDVALRKFDIETRPFISGNLLCHPAFENYGDWMDFPNANLLTKSGSYIGNNQFLTDENYGELKASLDYYAEVEL